MRIILSLGLLFLFAPLFGQHTVQWRGPSRDGIYPDKGLLKTWPETGPTLLKTIEGVGKGYSQPVLDHDMIYVTGIQKDTMDVISAYTPSGELRWQKTYGHAWANSYPDTRCTPTIQNNKIYLISGMGAVCCLDAKDGTLLWSQDANTQFQGESHRWGISESVLLTDQAAIYVTGGEKASVVAYDKNSGKLLWQAKSLGGSRAYASPILIERNNMNIVVALTANDLIGIDANNGNILWNYDLANLQPNPSGKGVNANTPIFHNGEIFVTSGYNHPATMFSLADDNHSISLKWTNDTLDTHHGGVVLLDGTIYGSNWLNNAKGQWVSMDWNTGRVNWVKDWYTKGSIISADGMLYCYEEKAGNVALVQPDVSDFKITGTLKVEGGEGPYWAHPAIYNGQLYLRHGNVLLIYNIK